MDGNYTNFEIQNTWNPKLNKGVSDFDTRMKDIYIADLANFDEGKLFDGFFLVLPSSNAPPKTNKPYLNLILGDKTGQLEGRVWELWATRASPKTSTRATSSRPRQRLPLRRPAADEDRPVAQGAQPGEVDKSDLLPSTTYDVADLWRQLLSFVESFTNPDLKRLLTTLLADPALAAAYREAPAAGSCTTPGWAACWSTWSACSPWPTASPRTTRCSTATCCSPA
jgi:hypothetical protein